MGKTAHNLVDMAGQKFNRMLVIERAGTNQSRKALWKCLCDCGTEKIVSGRDLRCGHIKSCGCLNVELRNKRIENSRGKPRLDHKGNYTHEMSNKSIYGVWTGMKGRCNNPNHSAYKNYGGRGIKVCEKWLIFENFYADMGGTYKKGLTIERIDNNIGYSPENCVWKSRKEQNKNKRSNRIYTVNGITGNIAELSRVFNIPYGTVYERLTLGTPPEIAFTTPKIRN
jgi:hypothetical protein